MNKVVETKIDELIPDDKNFNKGTQFGEHLMDKSVRKLGLGRSILIDKNNRIIAGNKTAEKAGELGFERVVVVETDGNTLVAVKRTDVDLDTAKGRELALADNATSKANLAWDEDALFDMQEAFNFDFDAEAWGVRLGGEEYVGASTSTDDETEEDDDTEDEDDDEQSQDFHSLMCEDRIFNNENDFDIPTLLPEAQPTSGLLLPFAGWGTDSRAKKGIKTYHFYVDDYRFEAIWKNPIQVINSGVKELVEPNLSLFDTTPIAYGIFQIYRKRWIARYFQECGICVYADLNVAKKFQQLNKLGIPKGYNAFATRGYSDREEYLREEIAIAQEISGKEQPNMIVYGGGENIQKICKEYGVIYVEQFMGNRSQKIKTNKLQDG